MSEILSADSGGIDASWNAWRARALNALLIPACLLSLPLVIPGLLGKASFPPNWRVPIVALYLLLLLNTICLGWGFRVRCWTMAILAYFAAGMALANRGLVGYGRIGLAVYPFAVIILLGARAGWIAVALSLGTYGAFTAFSAMGMLRAWNIPTNDPTAPALWLLQGLGLALAMVPGVVLLDRFRVQHMRVLDAERRVSNQLHDEIVRRTAAYDSLDHARAEQLRLEEKISQLGEEERRHLGREIHDGLCQQLTAALLRCTALEERLKSHETDAAAQAERLRLLIQEMLDAAYVISKGVWPVGPGPDDLVPALQLLATRTAEEFGLICDFRHKGDTTVANGQMAMHLYRIAQEAVNNSVKHARASRVSLLIEGNAGGIVLKVTDDGCGGMDGGSPGGGMGLDIMAYRARTMGGTLTIAHTEGGGTEVCCTVPRARVESLEGACDGK